MNKTRKTVALLLGLLLALLMLPAAPLQTAAATPIVVPPTNLTEATAFYVPQNTQFLVDFPTGTQSMDERQAHRYRFFTFTMPFDGVLNITATRTGGPDTGLPFRLMDGGNLMQFFPGGALRPGTTQTTQHSLRAGQYNFRVDWNNANSTSAVFEFFVTPSHDITWDGTVDVESNDTPATATPIGPNTMVTGNVGATNRRGAAAQRITDEADIYRFTVTETTEIEVTLRNVCYTTGGAIHLWVHPLDFDGWLGGNHISSGAGSANGNFAPQSRRWTLQPGDYRIQIQTQGGSIWDVRAYELTLTVISGNVASVPTTPLRVVANGEEVEFPGGQGPVIRDDRTLVPVRGVFEELGFTVDWDIPTSTATIATAEIEIRVTIGSAVFYVNGAPAPQQLEVQAQIINDRTMVPIRLLLEAADFNVGWLGPIRTVYVTGDTR